ncbi:MAG TPA: PTS transporter subunit EIIC, partial [Allosphingosinicella sp.]
LAGAVCFFVTVEGAKTLLTVPPEALAGFAGEAAQGVAAAAWKAKQLSKLSIPAGVLSGVVAGLLYNRYSDIKLPEYLAFFGGRRFVPIAAGVAGLVGALMFGLGFPALETAIDSLSRWVVGAGSVGLFLYGTLNRLLIVTGLHHILNNIAWFIIGDFNGVTGDLKRYYAGDPTAGAFMAGFFPVMMFGLPAACLAMYRSARPERRKAVGGMFASLALTSLLTGVTEPIEFSFMFLAPALYAVHAVLTGISMVVMDLLGVKLGFGFSAGLFDYILGYGLSTRALLLIPVGLVYFAVYYAAFRFCIVRFNLKTPGREEARAEARAAASGDRGRDFVGALGGAGNLVSVDACMTRLRLTLADADRADEAGLKALGARGVLRLAGGGYQVVLGPIADQVAGEIRAAISSAGQDEEKLADALGGLGNVRRAELHGNRLLVELRDSAAADEERLRGLGVRGVARSQGGLLHILLAPEAASWGQALSAATA